MYLTIGKFKPGDVIISDKSHLGKIKILSIKRRYSNMHLYKVITENKDTRSMPMSYVDKDYHLSLGCLMKQL